MEEVDGTIIPILKELGCRFEVQSIAEFGTNEIVESVSRGLFAINKDFKFPIKLPQGNAGRFRICTALSNAISEVGFGGESGYQQFLYPNEKDMRKLLIWLIDKLPKATEEDSEEQVLGADAMLNRSIFEGLRSWSAQRWTPFAGNERSSAATASTFSSVPLEVPRAKPDKATARYYQEYQAFIPQQCPSDTQYVPSLIERGVNEMALQQEKEAEWEEGNVEERMAARAANVSKTLSEAFRMAFQHYHEAASNARAAANALSAITQAQSTLLSRRAQFEQETEQLQAQMVQEDGQVAKVTEEGKVEEDEDAIRAQMEEELAALEDTFKQLAEQIAALTAAADSHVSSSRQFESEMVAKEAETKTLEDAYKVKKRTLDLLPNAEENLSKLAAIAAQSSARLVSLGKEWEEHRGPLLNKYRRRKQAIQDRKDDARTKLEQIKVMRKEMKQMAVDVRERDDEYKQSLAELNKLPKSINRQVYVRRIMDIVKNLDRQKGDIRKILSDVRGLQRDINMVGETSKRSFAETDEVIFQSARRKDGQGKSANPTATASFKLLSTLRDGFDELARTCTDMGKTRNQLKDLQSNIEALEARNTKLNMQRIKKDLEDVRKENEQLTNKMKK